MIVNKKKLIILDFDGVIVDTLPNMKISWQYVRKKYCLKPTFNDYKKFIGLPFFDILKNLKIKKNIKKIRSSYYIFSKNNFHKLIIKKKIIKDLKRLKQHYYVAIFTSKDRFRTKKIVHKLKIKFVSSNVKMF